MAEKTQSVAPGAEIDAAGARELYRRMRLIRTFEDTVQSQFQKSPNARFSAWKSSVAPCFSLSPMPASPP
jgi:hypothetical protein